MNTDLKSKLIKWLPFSILVVMFALFYLLGFNQYFNFNYLQDSHAVLKQWVDQFFFLSIFIFGLTYIIVTATSLPIAAFLTILGDPLAKIIGKSLSPDGVTVLSIVTGVLIAPALYFDQQVLAFVLLLLTGLFDTLDGTVARLFGKCSSFGTILDIVGDRAVETAIILGLFFVSPDDRALPALLMLGSAFLCVTSFLVVGIFSENDSQKGFYYSPGLMERPEAFCFFGLMILLPSFFPPLAYLFSFLVSMTALVRMIEFKKYSES